MQVQLSITIDRDVYYALKEVAGPGRVSRFVEDAIRPLVLKNDNPPKIQPQTDFNIEDLNRKIAVEFNNQE